ncbi:MAG: bifunctional ADP-dependent NAD(P)H-hydrate dehydratase/NAD(P)H-hydrate epimerase, partial [Thermodesulfatator sp.]
MRISTVEQMHSLDRRAIENYGIEEKLLMENAAHAVYFVIMRHFGDVRGRRFVTFAGPGNNGGDAITVSRKLHSNGARVKIYLMSSPDKYRGSARMNYEIARRIGIEMEEFSGDNALVRASVEGADAIIDGILGTGISREVSGKYEE